MGWGRDTIVGGITLRGTKRQQKLSSHSFSSTFVVLFILTFSSTMAQTPVDSFVKSVSEDEDVSKKTKKAETTSDKAKKPRDNSKKISKEVQDKIMTYFGQELEADRTNVSKQEVAEGSGFAKAGSHRFFYSWQDLQNNKHWITKSGGKDSFCLTDVGKCSIPKGIVLVAKKKDNSGKQQSFLKMLLKQCKEAKSDKCADLFNVFADGEAHSEKELAAITGYANLKSKGLGYPLTHMMKKMKILEKTEDKKYRFTDKCFPEGRPVAPETP